MGNMLEDECIPFDIIDDGIILDAAVTEEGLHIGNVIYRHVVLPECRFMSENIKEKIAPFVGKGKPIISSKNKKVRIMTRILDNSRLYFLFNEGINPTKEIVNFTDYRYIYEIDIKTGNMYRREKRECEIICGEIKVFLATDELFNTLSEELEYSGEITGFVQIGHDRFIVNEHGTESVHSTKEAAFDESFSGTVYYLADYSLTCEPKAGERYRIRIDDSSVSASAFIDGNKVGEFGILPMIAEIDGSVLKKSGKIEIRVSNTAANELIAKRAFIEIFFPKEEVGPYTKSFDFEERRPPLKLGKVFIEKYK